MELPTAILPLTARAVRRAALPIAALSRLGKQRLDDVPLGIREVHGELPMRGVGESRKFAATALASVASAPNGVSGSCDAF
jgi:hypothetical protein